MSILDYCLLVLTPVGCLVGGWSIYWARGQDHPRLILWGKRLFIFTLLLFGLLAFLAACAHARGLAPLGISAGLLVVGMLWESAEPAAAEGGH